MWLCPWIDPDPASCLTAPKWSLRDKNMSLKETESTTPLSCCCWCLALFSFISEFGDKLSKVIESSPSASSEYVHLVSHREWNQSLIIFAAVNREKRQVAEYLPAPSNCLTKWHAGQLEVSWFPLTQAHSVARADFLTYHSEVTRYCGGDGLCLTSTEPCLCGRYRLKSCHTPRPPISVPMQPWWPHRIPVLENGGPSVCVWVAPKQALLLSTHTCELAYTP